MPKFDTIYKATVPVTISVYDKYNMSLETLNYSLTPELEFIDFRPIRAGDMYLSVYARRVLLMGDNGVALVICDRYGIQGESLTYHDGTPRLIIGKKPKPRRVVFEKIRIGTLIHKGEYWEDPHNGHFNRMNSPLHAFPCDYPIFNRVEDNG